jgi:hypothetical protein
MDARIRIAAAVWLLTMALAVPAGAVMFLIVVSTMNLSGHGQVSIAPLLVVALVPPLMAALAARLMAPHVARVSGQQIHAGPVVLGCVAGFLFGWWLGSSGGALAFITIAMGSFAGALAGTFIQAPVRPLIVGIAFAIVTELTVLLSS